jgi:RNA polymerase sigma-70 factor (ECF subfamily)
MLVASTVDAELPAEPDPLGPRLREIYEEQFPLIWRGLRRLGVPPPLVEDAVQDVFLVLCRRSGDFEGRSSLRTWIYGIMLRVAKDYRRAEVRRIAKVGRLRALLASESATANCPAEAAERSEANQLLHALLGALATDQREVLVLAELEGLPVREVAQAVGIRVRTCQRRLRAAHQAFEAALARSLEPDGRLSR